MSNESSQSPIAFRAPATIPIVGQPFELHTCLVTALLTCKCEGRHPMLVLSNAATQCPVCRKGYIVQGVLIEPGQPPKFKIGVIPPDDLVGDPKETT